MGKIYKQLSIEERALNASAMGNQRLLCRIRSLHTDSDSVLGSPRIWDGPRHEGETCGLSSVARLMRVNGLRDIPQKKRWGKKPSGQRPAGIQNHLECGFSADEPNTSGPMTSVCRSKRRRR